MTKKRRALSAAFKAKVALASIRGGMSIVYRAEDTKLSWTVGYYSVQNEASSAGDTPRLSAIAESVL